jgi:hypothetical protein
MGIDIYIFYLYYFERHEVADTSRHGEVPSKSF